MKRWSGAAAICVNKANELLMIKQGTPDENKTWSIPGGGKEQGETYEQCCVREVVEETGYEVKINGLLSVKETILDGYQIDIHYYAANVIGGGMRIQDPDELIYEIAWKSANEIKKLELSYPDDRTMLLGTLSDTIK